MVAVMFMSVALVALVCVLAYTLAIYALPFFVGLAAAQFAYQTGSGLVGAGLVGLFSAGVAFGILAVLFETIRSPVIRLIVALVFAAPAAVAPPTSPSSASVMYQGRCSGCGFATVSSSRRFTMSLALG